MFKVTKEWLDKHMTPRGGYCYPQTKALGVDWPLISGWKKRLVGVDITDEQKQVFEAGAMGKSKAKEASLMLLGEKPMKAKEKRAASALAKQIRMHDGSALETWKKSAKKANAIAKSTRKVTASGVSVSSNEFLHTYEWRRVRMVALKKYGPVCQCCGDTPSNGAVMNVDHIKPRKLFPHLALDVNNLQILCNPCNHGKGNWDMTDWRDAAQHQEYDDADTIRFLRSL